MTLTASCNHTSHMLVQWDRSKSNLITVLSCLPPQSVAPLLPVLASIPWSTLLAAVLMTEHWCIVRTPETCASAEVCFVGGDTTEVLFWSPVTFLMPHSLGSSLYARCHHCHAHDHMVCKFLFLLISFDIVLMWSHLQDPSYLSYWMSTPNPIDTAVVG